MASQNWSMGKQKAVPNAMHKILFASSSTSGMGVFEDFPIVRLATTFAVGKIVTDMFALGLPARSRPTGLGRYCTYIQNLSTTPIFFLLLALSLLLIIAGDVEINPGPFNGENEKRTKKNKKKPYIHGSTL